MALSCCFETCIPPSKPDCVVIKPDGCTFATGLARQYSENYDTEAFNGRVSKQDFKWLINHLNDKLYSFMPCPMMWGCAYLLAIPTLGLSLLCTACVCVNEAEESV